MMSPPMKHAGFAAGRVAAAMLSNRTFHSSIRILSQDDAKFKFMASPSPPKLPEKEQKEWEELIRRASQGTTATETEHADKAAVNSTQLQGANGPIEKNLMHPDMRKVAPPEFEGDVNPKTGEIGGPKNEPLRWGANGDWSFNGKVTDF